MTTLTSRQIQLAARPVGEPRLDDFELVHTAVPRPAAGQIVVRNTWMSVDPYMRGRMDDAPSYIPPFELGQPLEGAAVGEVVASESDTVAVGATVSHFLGWRDYAVVDAADAALVDTDLAPPQAYLERARPDRPHSVRRRSPTSPPSTRATSSSCPRLPAPSAAWRARWPATSAPRG